MGDLVPLSDLQALREERDTERRARAVVEQALADARAALGGGVGVIEGTRLLRLRADTAEAALARAAGEDRLNDIATLLFAFWHHPAPSTRAQIEAFIARHVDGVTIAQLRECKLEPLARAAGAVTEELHLATYGEQSCEDVPTACGIRCSTWDTPLRYVWERGKATCQKCLAAGAGTERGWQPIEAPNEGWAANRDRLVRVCDQLLEQSEVHRIGADAELKKWVLSVRIALRQFRVLLQVLRVPGHAGTPQGEP